MLALWAFLKSRAGKALAVLAAIGAALAYVFLRGRSSGRQAEAATHAADDTARTQAAAQTYQNADDAAAAVDAAAKAQPTPDLVKRDDLDNTGF